MEHGRAAHDVAMAAQEPDTVSLEKLRELLSPEDGDRVAKLIEAQVASSETAALEASCISTRLLVLKFMHTDNTIVAHDKRRSNKDS